MNKRWKMVGAALAAVGLILATTLTVAADGPRGRGPAGAEGTLADGPAMGRMGGRAQSPANSEAVATALGLTAEELRAQLRDGATLADLAEAKGVDLQDLRDAAEGARQASVLERLGQALEDGKITEAFSNWFKRGADAGYVNGPQGDPTENPTITAAAQALGMTPEQVELQMWGGRTLADLAERAGVDLTTVQSAVEAAQKAAATERIQQAVTDGRLTQAQASWMIEGVDGGFNGLGRFDRLGEGPDRGAMPKMGGRPGMGR